MTLTSLSFDPRLVLTGGLGSTIGADGQGAEPGPSRIPSPAHHADPFDYESDPSDEPDPSAGVGIVVIDGSDDAAEIGSLANAFSGAGRLPAHVPATSGPASAWSRPPQSGVGSNFAPPSGASSPTITGHQNLFDAFGGSPSGLLPEPNSPAYGVPHVVTRPKQATGDEGN